MFRKFLFVTGILSMSVVCACSSEDAPAAGGDDADITPAEMIELTAAQKDIVASYNQFAVNLYDKVLETQNGNFVISPMSVTMALSMTANGAKGETLEEMTSLWGLKGSELDALNSLNRRFLDVLPSIDPKADFSLANSIWLNGSGNSVLESYNETVARLYDGEAFCVPFNSVTKQLNSWIEKKTNGNIKDMIDGTPEGEILLANALYFHAPWTGKFDKSLTKNQPFHNADGKEPNVAMMNGGERIYEARAGEELTMIEIPYGNNAFMMRIMMPANENVALGEALELSKSLGAVSCNLRMPRFEVESMSNLVEPLKAMGLIRMIDGTGDFSAISPDVKGFNTIQHNAMLKADEEGTTAAAATVIGWFTSAGPTIDPLEVTIDHPFVFTVEEKSTGLIIMAGCVRNL